MSSLVFNGDTSGSITFSIPSVAGTNNIAIPALSGTLALTSGSSFSSTTILGGSIDATPIGATTANTGSFTTLSASSTVSGTGFSTYLASPPAIGGTAAASGAFTTLSASSTVTLSGGTANGVAYLNGSKVLTTGSALTYNGTGLGVGVSSAGFALDVGGSNGTNIGLRSTGTASAVFRAYVNGAESGTIGFLNGGGQYFEVAGSEQMRLTSTGLGIGTSSPAQVLDIQKAQAWVTATSTTGTNSSVYKTSNTGGASYFGRDNSTGGVFGSAAYATVVYGSGAYPMTFHTNDTKQMTLDASGNLGLGVTPSASWVSTSRNFQIYSSAFSSDGAQNDSTHISSNAVRTASGSPGTWNYIGSNTTSLYEMKLGAFKWYTAPSGTAGNPITFTQAMTLDASGNLLVGTTGQTFSGTRLQVNGGGVAISNLGSGNNPMGQIAAFNNDAVSGGLTFQTLSGGALSERARIDSSGNLLVGTTALPSASGGNYGAALIKMASGSSSTGRLVIGHGDSTGARVAAFYYGTTPTAIGSIDCSTTATAYNTSSDYRLKNTIAPMQNALAKVAQLKPVTYKWNADDSDGQGFIAHELQTVIPEAVTGEKDAVDAEGNPVYQGIDPSKVVATLTAAIQEQQAIIELLQADIALLKGK